MDATKHHELWETGVLNASLEGIIQEYASSVGSTCGGIPSEIFQGAVRIPAEHANVHASGPADCIDDTNETHDTGGNLEEPTIPSEDCVGIIDGGVDDISPLQIWDEIMKKYKVSQIC